jgi:Tfp pilus assembly protein PilN
MGNMDFDNCIKWKNHFFSLSCLLRVFIIVVILVILGGNIYIWLGPMRTLQKDNAGLTQKLSDSATEVTTLKDKKDEFHHENLSLRELLDSTKKDAKTLQQTNSSLKTSLSLSQDKVTSLSDRKDELHRENLHLKDLMNPIEKMAEKIYPSVERNVAIGKLFRELEELRKQASNLEQQAASRQMNAKLLSQLQRMLPDKTKTVTVTSVMGDGEAFGFATQIKDALVKQGYDINGVNQTVFSRPIMGQVFDSDTLTITIGTKP